MTRIADFFELDEQPPARPIEQARIAISGISFQCPHCRARWQTDTDFRPCGNPFLSDRLLLATFCRSCTGFSFLIFKGMGLALRKPVPWEATEIAGTAHLLTWRSAFVMARTEQSP